MNVKIFKTEPQNNVFFAEETLEYGSGKQAVETYAINLYDEIKYQEIIGFGAAVTEAAAYNYAQLSPEGKKQFLQLYYSRKDGIGYNFGRTHINSCDFTPSYYCYVEEGDMTLETFSIDREKEYVLPKIGRAHV